MNCLNPQNGDPCGECEVCKGLEEGSILDVVEIDAASNNGVDSIRSLIEEANFTPTTAKYRVYIIDEVHMLSVAAFNALLKTLEEPPPTWCLSWPPPRSTSCCHHPVPVPAVRLPPHRPRGHRRPAGGDRRKEEAQLDHDAALLIARVADGAMRDALSLLDQCLGRDRHVTLDIVNQTAGVAAREYLTALAQAVTEENAAAALEIIDGLYKESKDMSRLCEELGEYFRGLMLVKTMKDPGPLLTVSPRSWRP